MLDENAKFGATVTLFLIITLALAISPLTVLYIYPIVIRMIAKKKVNVNQTNESDKQYDYKNLIHCIPLTVTDAITCIGFAAVHIFSIISLHQYADEVLISRNIHIMAPLPNDVLSVTILIAGMSFSVIILAKRFSKSK